MKDPQSRQISRERLRDAEMTRCTLGDNNVIFYFPKGHVKIIFLPVIALSFPNFCSKLEQTLNKHQEQHS